MHIAVLNVFTRQIISRIIEHYVKKWSKNMAIK